jgi:AcrR family transcriptional regulator
VPRDATETRDRLLRAAERLFATHGIFEVTVREIVAQAGQRNVSALTYHFGGREEVLRAILVRHGDALDEERGRLSARLGPDPSARDLLGVLLVPYGSRLATPEGRDYVRIVAQLGERFPVWDSDDAVNPPNLRRILRELQRRPASLPAPVRRERLVGVIQLMTAAIAQRAALIENGGTPELDEPAFLANLADMLVGVLEAARGAPLPPVPTVPG